MTDGLVDKGIDEDERDDAPRGGRRRRTALIGGGVVAALALGGLAIAQPWAGSDDEAPAPGAAPVVTERPSAEPLIPELSNRLAPSVVPDGAVPSWVNDGEANDFFDAGSTMASNVLLVGEGADFADGPWVGVTVVLLDKFERKSFDPIQYVMAADGQQVLINGLEGIFAKNEFGGDTSELAYGPVNEGYVVTLSAVGLTQAEMVDIATELTLLESDDDAVAWPQFGATVSELALAPLASYEQPSFGFGGGFQLAALGGSSPTATSVNYADQDEDFVAVSNDVLLPGLDTLALARFVIEDEEEVTVHDQPAVTGSIDELFGGTVVVWQEGGRSLSVFANDDVDVVAIAESVTELDEQEWADLIAASEANQGEDDFGGQPEETWLIGAGELEDSTTWLVEGAVDDEGNATWCTAAMDDGSSMSGCNSSDVVDPPAIISVGAVGADGDVAPAYVATVPLDRAGAILRFTAGDGTVVETPIHEIRPEWPFLAAAIALTDVGTLEIVAADGTVIETLEITDDDLGVAFG